MCMRPKPQQWSSNHAAMFQDPTVIAAYPSRPPYPPAIVSALLSLIPPAVGRRILDAGCGPGILARMLATESEAIDAVDCSAGMIELGRRLPGGTDPRIIWQISPMETAQLHGPYALIVAAASLHWMDWECVLPRMAEQLAPGAVLALIDNPIQPAPWDPLIGPIISRYSLNRDFSPYTCSTIVDALIERRLFVHLG